MSKKRSGNSRVSYHLKNSGYFMEEAFSQSEYEIVKNDSLELNAKNQDKFYLKPHQLNNLIQINNSTYSNTSNRKKQQSSYLSPRLLTASTTTQRSSFNNSNMLHSTSNSQNLGINYALQNSYQNKNRSLKLSLHEKVQKKPSKSVYNSNDNVFLDDICIKVNSSDIYNKKEKGSQLLVASINSERSEKIGKSKEICKNIFLTTHDKSSDAVIETIPNTKQLINYKNSLPQKQETIQQDTNFFDEFKLNSQESENKQLSKPHNLLINNYSNPKQPILSKIFSSQANLKTKNLVYQQSQNLPITSRLQMLVNNKVQQKFSENSQNENTSIIDAQKQIQAKSQRDLSINSKDEKQNQTEISIASPLDSKRKIQQEQKTSLQLNYQLLVEKENIFMNVNYLFQYFINEYKRVSNMYKLSSTYRQGIQNLYQAHAFCTSKLLSHIEAWQETKKNKNSNENKTTNIVEQTTDSIAIDVFLSKNPMQIMSVSLACAKIYINLKKPIKAIPILKQCKRLSDLYRNQNYKMKCYRALSECFIMIRKESIAEKFVKKYLQLSWCNKSDKNELQAYDMLGLISYYNGDIERAKFYHHRMANNILEDENSQLRKISILNQVTKQKRRDEKMKDENPPINKKVEGDENTFIDSSDEENEEILLVPEPNQQNQMDEKNNNFDGNPNKRFFKERYQDSNEQYKQYNDQDKISPQVYLASKQGFELRKQPFKTIPGPVNNQKTDFGTLKPPIIISHLSRNRALLNFQKFELQNKIDSSAQMEINYWEPYDLKKAEKILLRLQKVLQYFKHILNDFSNDMNSNILLPDERNKYFSDKQFSIKHYLYKLLSQNNLLQLKTSRQIKK
ncbi:histidine acid phosphatase family protein (macronuclear) [Tetrahymena thermophila SB210]|uniref:Histidine acid phosphatase family protein n=1 Tax=Tetrahymena thermophila (strain SB210) TaxID=312017 RepID=Q23QL8_TETTS|nr:histidine acid phosphatase family protein [Tetrahymena thermophila SB210]EAR98870.2 histidine acid phosphatase family protein [Tetrahymena thermophila SB210]|eukprot:XP_001019115.2 histidine acid phosphatase family protein [Tetrahymena thermophila SB210]